MEGNVQTYKASLVKIKVSNKFMVLNMMKFFTSANGQIHQILLAIAAYYDYEIWQMDVKIAFLNGSLDKDVYVTQPEGFVNPKDASKYANFRVPAMDRREQNGVGIFVLDEIVERV